MEVFEGTPEEAIARAAGANSNDKLQMGTSEKANAGWRLVVMASGLSKAQQAEAADVSGRLIAYMRTAKNKLMALNHDLESLAELTWERARRLAVGEDEDDWSQEEDLRVEEMAKGLRKALGPTAELQPGIFMRAIEVYSPMLARAVAEQYVGAYREAHGLPEG